MLNPQPHNPLSLSPSFRIYMFLYMCILLFFFAISLLPPGKLGFQARPVPDIAIVEKIMETDMSFRV